MPVVVKLLEPAMTAGNLKTLELDNLDLGDNPNVMELFPRCTSLKDFSFQCSLASEDEIVMNVLQFPNLTSLDLSMTKITGYGVKKILNQLNGKLEFLGLHDCQKLSHDAVEFAQSRVTRVGYVSRKPQPIKSFRDRYLL